MTTWKVRADGGTLPMVADAAEVRRAVALFADPAGSFEVMSLTSGRHRTFAGVPADAVVNALPELPTGQGLYFRINPGAPDRTDPANNPDILHRNWVYIDVDPVKPKESKNDSATDAEKTATLGVLNAINEYLASLGWPAPVVLDSGNGFALLYRCRLENDKLTQATYQRLLKVLGEKFGGEAGIVDKSVHNANRLVKLPGTWARKGRPSDDRPHRVARLMSIPELAELLTLEQMAAVGTAATPAEPPTGPESYTPPAGKATTAYGKKALDAECARVALAPPGERNNALNRAAFSLGQLVAGGVLTEDEVTNRLTDAARRCGLDDDAGCGESGIRKTIRSGLDAGATKPRGVPESHDPTAKFGKARPPKDKDEAAADDGRPLTLSMSAVKPRAVDWLIRNRIPKRFVTIFAGRTGVGKSYVACDLVARLSAGAKIPGGGGECFSPAGTLILSEDSHEYVLAPRLISLGADLKRVHAMTWEAMARYHLSDTAMLDRAIAEVPGGISLLMIDPPTNFLGETDEHKNAEVRQLVMRVIEWADRRDLAVLFITHVNKGSGKGVDAIERVIGSVAWVTTARVAHVFCPDPDSPTRCLWVPAKINIGPKVKGLAYRITEGCVEWLGEADTSADDALGGAKSGGPRKRSVGAAVWLAEQFASADEIPSDAIWSGRKGTDISENALKEAKDEMGIRARQKTDGDGERRWVWFWPTEARSTWSRRAPEAHAK